jgi:hypothetical protein
VLNVVLGLGVDRVYFEIKIERYFSFSFFLICKLKKSRDLKSKKDIVREMSSTKLFLSNSIFFPETRPPLYIIISIVKVLKIK